MFDPLFLACGSYLRTSCSVALSLALSAGHTTIVQHGGGGTRWLRKFSWSIGFVIVKWKVFVTCAALIGCVDDALSQLQ